MTHMLVLLRKGRDEAIDSVRNGGDLLLVYYFSKRNGKGILAYLCVSSEKQNAGNARNIRLHRHTRNFKKLDEIAIACYMNKQKKPI